MTILSRITPKLHHHISQTKLWGIMFTRLQAEKKIPPPPNFISAGTKQKSDVSKLASALPSFPNTIFSSNFLKKHSHSWQGHLEKIADFLVVGEGVWWTRDSEGSIQFFDGIGMKKDHMYTFTDQAVVR